MKKLALLAVSAVTLPFATPLFADTYSTSHADAWSQDGNTLVFDSSANGALATDANRAALAALGLDKIANALWTANSAAHTAMTARRDERGERDAEKASGTTPELRKTVAQLLVKAGKRVNAVYDLDPENKKAATAIKKVCGVISDFKRIASEAKHRKGDTPDPEPEPMSNGDAPAA